MVGSPEAEAMIDYIKKTVLRRTDIDIREETPLVSSGLVDSFALIEVLLELEQVTNRRISPGRVGAKDMDSVSLMLKTAERVGVPRR